MATKEEKLEHAKSLCNGITDAVETEKPFFVMCAIKANGETDVVVMGDFMGKASIANTIISFMQVTDITFDDLVNAEVVRSSEKAEKEE